MLGNGDGTFLTPTAYSFAGAPERLAIADLDRDGYLDVAVAGFGKTVVFRNGPASAAPVLGAVISNVVSGATFQPVVAAGGFVTVYGQDFTSTTADWGLAVPDGVTLPTVLGGVSVSINQINCYISYVSPTQINVLTPPSANIIFTEMVPVTVSTQKGTMSATAWMTQVAPGFFSYSLDGKQYPVALLANTSVYVAPIVQVTIGGQQATVSYAGMTFAGVFQVNVQVPPAIADGEPRSARKRFVDGEKTTWPYHARCSDMGAATASHR